MRTVEVLCEQFVAATSLVGVEYLTWKAKEPSPPTKDYNKKLSEMYGYLFRHLHSEVR